jgi:hypothetical protein
LHGTVVKVCKSDRDGTVAGTRGNGEVAPTSGSPQPEQQILGTKNYRLAKFA